MSGRRPMYQRLRVTTRNETMSMASHSSGERNCGQRLKVLG